MRRNTDEFRPPSTPGGAGHGGPARAWLDVDLEVEQGVEAQPRAMLGQHTVIGRTPGLALTLDHDTVSRKHAELFCDPFGRWWIRDLGSTNGTSVNDETVGERVLRSGDRIGIGDYRLRFNAGTVPDVRVSAPSLEDTLDGSAAPSWMRTLREVDPPQISATHLRTLMALSRRLLEIEDVQERLLTICELLVTNDFHATVALVVRIQANEPIRILAGPRRAPHIADEPPYVSRTVLRQALETKEAVLGTNLPQVNPGLELTLSAEVVPLASVAVPVQIDGAATTDILYANLPPHYGRSDWLALLALTGEAFQQSEIAWTARRHAQQHAAIERELETARIIQHALVPKSPRYPGLDVAIGFEPCRWVGGDYVDTVALSDGRVLCTVADVCGKGLQAALVTFSIHTMIRALADTGHSLTQVLDRLNNHLCDYLPDDSFVTLVCCTIDPRTGAMEYVNAGHLPAFIIDELGHARSLPAGVNPALGLTEFKLVAQSDRISPGEAVFLYTDGLTELRNNAREMLGEEMLGSNVAKVYKEKHAEDIEQTALGVTAILDAFRGEELPEDDRAFLLARRASATDAAAAFKGRTTQPKVPERR